jgi:hypothetical protein
MKTSKVMFLFLLLSVLFSAVTLVHSQTVTVSDAQTAVHEAYKAIVKASNDGANVATFTDQLNLALNLTTQAQALLNSDPQEAQNLASQAQVIAQNVTAHATTAKAEGLLQQPLVVGVIVAVLLAVGVLVYMYGPNVFWTLWLRFRRNYHIKNKDSTLQNNGKKANKTVITGEQVCAVILAATIIAAFFITVPFFLPNSTGETFSELGLLGPNMMLSDYPSEIVAGDTVNLNVYVGNHMGQPMYYIVMVKLGDNETAVGPASVLPVQQFVSVVPNNGNWTFPVSETFTQAGLNQKMIFELWIYNETINQNQYHERSVWINLNVTAPVT